MSAIVRHATGLCLIVPPALHCPPLPQGTDNKITATIVKHAKRGQYTVEICTGGLMTDERDVVGLDAARAMIRAASPTASVMTVVVDGKTSVCITSFYVCPGKASARVNPIVRAPVARLSRAAARAARAPVAAVEPEPVADAPAAPVASESMVTLRNAITTDQYHDGREPIGSPIWTEGIAHGFSKQKVGGLFRAAIANGWIGTTQDGNDSTTWITAAGHAAMIAAMNAKRAADAAPVPLVPVDADPSAPVVCGSEIANDAADAAAAKALHDDETCACPVVTDADHDDAAKAEALMMSAGLIPARATLTPADVSPHEGAVLRAIVNAGGVIGHIYADTIPLAAVGGTWAMVMTALRNLALLRAIDMRGSTALLEVRIIADIGEIIMQPATDAVAAKVAKVTGAAVAVAPTYAVGTVLRRTFKGTDYVATICDGGRVDLNGVGFKNMNAAIRSICGYVLVRFFATADTTIVLPHACNV
jgi:hypothetical protein